MSDSEVRAGIRFLIANQDFEMLADALPEEMLRTAIKALTKRKAEISERLRQEFEVQHNVCQIPLCRPPHLRQPPEPLLDPRFKVYVIPQIIICPSCRGLYDKWQNS